MGAKWLGLWPLLLTCAVSSTFCLDNSTLNQCDVEFIEGYNSVSSIRISSGFNIIEYPDALKWTAFISHGDLWLINDRTNNMRRTVDQKDFERAVAKEDKANANPKVLMSYYDNRVHLIDRTGEWAVEERNGMHVAYRSDEEMALLGSGSQIVRHVFWKKGIMTIVFADCKTSVTVGVPIFDPDWIKGTS